MRKKARGVNSASKIAIRSMKIMISSLVSKVNPSQQRADFAARRDCSVVHPICHNLPICGRYALSSEAARGEWAQRLREGAQLLVAATGLRWLEIAGLQWQDVDWSGNRIYLRRTFIDGKIAGRLTTKKSKSAGAMAPLLARFLREWHGATVYAGPTDWVFASGKEKGRIPRVGNMLVSDHLRPAAIKSWGTPRSGGQQGIRLQRKSGKAVWVSQSASLAEHGIDDGEKEDPRTVQDILRHSKVATSLELYAQSTMQQRIAAQEKYLRRILPQIELVKVNGTKNGTGFTGGPLQGYDF
jgi:integrase